MSRPVLVAAYFFCGVTNPISHLIYSVLLVNCRALARKRALTDRNMGSFLSVRDLSLILKPEYRDETGAQSYQAIRRPVTQ